MYFPWQSSTYLVSARGVLSHCPPRQHPLKYAKKVYKGLERKKILWMYLKIFAVIVLKYMGLSSTLSFSNMILAWQTCLKTEVELELLTYVDMLLMIKIGERGGICHIIH